MSRIEAKKYIDVLTLEEKRRLSEMLKDLECKRQPLASARNTDEK